MADLDYIDSIVDQCLGTDSTRPPIGRQPTSGVTSPAPTQKKQPTVDVSPYPSVPSTSAARPAHHQALHREVTSQSMPSPVTQQDADRSLSYQHGNYFVEGGRPQEYRRGGHHEQQQYIENLPVGGGAGDAALRRIQMWEEKKRLKQLMSKREVEARGQEECTFHPNVQAARDSVLAHKISPGKGAKGTIGFGYGGGNSGLVGASPVDRASIASPSKLYKDNKAWGFDSFVDRQLYAREMRRQAEEDAEAVFALKNPEGRQRVTVPEPFEFGNKGRKSVRKALEAPTAAIASQLKREQQDFYFDDSSSYDPLHRSGASYESQPRTYRATDQLTAPTVPAGLFSLHASSMMMEHTTGKH